MVMSEETRKLTDAVLRSVSILCRCVGPRCSRVSISYLLNKKIRLMYVQTRSHTEAFFTSVIGRQLKQGEAAISTLCSRVVLSGQAGQDADQFVTSRSHD